IGIVVSVYPAIWGLGQLFTGKLADKFPKKALLFWGMLMQGIAIIFMGYATEMYHYILISVILGLGTAIVYPAFLAAIADYTNPGQRAESIGVFRLWRDSGYVFGALLSGALADAFGLEVAVINIGVLTALSALLIKFRMS
ncbi:MAG: MFS transporter, partial [Daejeonella sp.]|uniref:MFS transporter n=1 Tax=Daejeonella sp. TaxID=2805397 RepID=UPI003C7459E6